MASCYRRSSVVGRFLTVQVFLGGDRLLWIVKASVPSGQNCIFPMCAGGRDDGISTLHSHQYRLADEGVTEEINCQTFSKHCFAPHHNKVLMRGLLDQQVRHCAVGLLACTRNGDVGVYLDNFTFPFTLCHTLFECRTGYLLFVLLFGGESIVNFPFSPWGIWPSVHHLSCSPCCKPPLHDFVYHYLWSETSCDTGWQKSWTCILCHRSDTWDDHCPNHRSVSWQGLLNKMYSGGVRHRSGAQVQWYTDSVSLLLLTPFYVAFPFPSVISSGSRQVGILGEKN